MCCAAVSCVILSYYELKDTFCLWQRNIWLAFHLPGDIFSRKHTDERGGDFSRKDGSFQTFFNFACKPLSSCPVKYPHSSFRSQKHQRVEKRLKNLKTGRIF